MSTAHTRSDTSDALQIVALGNIPHVEVTSGIVSPGRWVADGVPILQIEQVQSGKLDPDVRVRITAEVHDRNKRSALRNEDLVLVLVGDVGRAARVTPQFSDWNVSSGVGVIRCVDPVTSNRCVIDWLEFWFATPTMQTWFAEQAKRPNRRAYLSVSTLRNDLMVPLPSVANCERYVNTLRTFQEQALHCTEIAEHTVALADSIFAGMKAAARTEPLALSTIATAHTGSRRQGQVAAPESGHRTVSAGEVLNSRTPCEPIRGQTCPDQDRWQRPGQLLIATRTSEATVVVDLAGDIVGARGTTAVRTLDAQDHWWLLHELRARSRDSSHPVFPGSGRELSARALSTISVDWPTVEVRRRFAEIAVLLHERAVLALAHRDDMRRMISALPEKFVRDLAVASSARGRETTNAPLLERSGASKATASGSR